MLLGGGVVCVQLHVFIVMCMLFTFCRTAIESLLKKFISAIGRKKGAAWVEVWQGRLDRWEGTRLRIQGLIWFAVTLSLAVLIPNILVVVNPAGALAAMFVLVFPGMHTLVTHFFTCIYTRSLSGSIHTYTHSHSLPYTHTLYTLTN